MSKTTTSSRIGARAISATLVQPARRPATAASQSGKARSSESTRLPSSLHNFSTGTKRTSLKARGIIYSSNGDPRELVRGHTWDLAEPRAGQVTIRVGLGSINPADINVIQGVYPAKPVKRALSGLDKPAFVGGNEGFGVVEEVHGAGGSAKLRKGDWVVFGQPQMGTWTSHMVCSADDVVKIDRQEGANSLRPLSEVMASTLQVNPATAYRMLHDFATLNPETDVLVQNTANSAVGQAVAQIASRALGVESINLVRGSSGKESTQRPDMDELAKSFEAIAQADKGHAPVHLFTYEQLADKSSGARERIKDILHANGKKRTIRLGLNALCGPDNANMVKLLGTDATLVTYGAMSKQPLSVPAGLVIFNNLCVRGFMMNKWYAQHGLQARQDLMAQLVRFYQNRTLEPPPATIVEINSSDSARVMTDKARDAISKSMGGYGGRKFFFKFV